MNSTRRLSMHATTIIPRELYDPLRYHRIRLAYYMRATLISVENRWGSCTLDRSKQLSKARLHCASLGRIERLIKAEAFEPERISPTYLDHTVLRTTWSTVILIRHMGLLDISPNALSIQPIYNSYQNSG